MRSCLSLILCLLLGAGSAASAQMTRDRAKTWEFGALLMGTSSESLDGDAESGLRVESETGWGFMGGYNFTNRLAVMAELSWVRPRYEATFVPDGGGPYANFDHHAEVDRLSTSSACMQVFMAVNLGLFEVFSRESHVFVNDADPSTIIGLMMLPQSSTATKRRILTSPVPLSMSTTQM